MDTGVYHTYTNKMHSNPKTEHFSRILSKERTIKPGLIGSTGVLPVDAYLSLIVIPGLIGNLDYLL